MKIKCPICNLAYEVPEKYIGQKIKCPKCHKPFEINDQLIKESADIIKNENTTTESVSPVYKTIDDFPENGLAKTFQAIGGLFLIIGIICALIGLAGVLNNTDENARHWNWIAIFSGIATSFSSIWFFGAYALICAVSRNTLEIHLLRKQQGKNDVEK
jgi:hypothetical protein